MDFIISWIQSTGMHQWIATSPSWFVYPPILALHSMGMAIIAGGSTVISLRILGAARDLPLAPMERFFPFIWLGFWVNAISGVGLFITDPEKLVNWDIWIKFAFLALALVTLRMLRAEAFGHSNPAREPLSPRSKVLAGALILFWAGTIWAGRFSAYIGAS